MQYIDINCDVGEGIGNEGALMPLISSCNIACGGHAGDEATIRKVIRLAKSNNVKIGMHPSYPDRENFGRIRLNISIEELDKSIRGQLQFFETIAEEEEASIHHIKPHGALYNDIAKDAKLANHFLDTVVDYKHLPIYVPYRSEIEKRAIARGFKVLWEAFADRNYNPDLSLVSRKLDNALIEQPSQVLEHLVVMIAKEKVKTVMETEVKIKANTFCVHGDTPSALEILMYLHRELPNQNIQIKK